MKILILCTGNSCRSQMAEGFLRSFDRGLEVFSAGTRPEKEVNPHAVAVMKEAGIDISGNRPEPVEKYLGQPFDHVVTVCDGARESCPAFSGKVGQRHPIGFEDPADARGPVDEVLQVYRSTRDQIRLQFLDWYNKIIA